MATWYVRTTGSDAAAGTSAATAFLTIGKAMGTANTSLVAGDTIYVGAGTYRVSASIAPTSMASMTYLYGDTDGSKTGDAGEVVVTPWGTDTSVPASVNVFRFQSKNNWTLGKLTVQGRPGSYPVQIDGTSANITLQDCTFYEPLYFATLTFGTVNNLVVERCRVFGAYGGIYILFSNSASGSGDIDANVTIRNCFVLAQAYAVQAAQNDANTARKTGGVYVHNCFLWAQDAPFWVTNTNFSTTYPAKIYNSLLIGTTTMRAAAASQMTEDYNVLIPGVTARVNVTAGANSNSTYSRNYRLSIGHEAAWGGVVRPFGEPAPAMPTLTWGGTSVPADDINGVTRPASGAGQTSTQQALGPFERSNSAVRETTTTRTGGTAIKIAGPGYHDFELAVSPVSTSVSVWSYKDAAYGTAATGPQLIIANAGEAGFGGTTITSTGSTAAWAAMTATFTPSSAGIVTVRLQSNATVGTANVYFDDFSVA